MKKQEWILIEFKNKIVENIDGKGIQFEHDSSKEAWEHYKKVYFDENGNCRIHNSYGLTDLNQLVMSNYKGGKYYNEPNIANPNRYYLLAKEAYKNTDKIYNLNEEYPGEKPNLSGECDFNFNVKKCNFFNSILKKDFAGFPRMLKYSLELLNECSETHHTLVNFSLMQTKGDMQGFKGRCLKNGESSSLDRADALVSYLSSYYQLQDESQKEKSDIIINAGARVNQNNLKEYLGLFKDVYDYCEKIYLIDEKEFVYKMIEEGRKLIKTGYDVIRYMNLALEFWDRKEIEIQKIYKKSVK